jgi:hypothetical protein
MNLARIAASIRQFFRPAAAGTAVGLVPPSGLTPDGSALYGLLGAVQNLEQATGNGFTSVADSTQTVTATAAAVARGILNRTGAPGGAVTETTPTATLIIQALQALGCVVPFDGSYQFRFRYINNSLGQTTTWTAGSGVTVTGTATIATNAWRDFLVTVDSSSAVTFTNIGGGSL